MSSLLAHVAAGLTLYFCRTGPQPRPHISMGLPVLLAIAPDFDYFGIWFFHLRYEQRFTHSLLFCLLLSSTVWLLAKRCWPRCKTRPGFWILSLAACSHLLLDMAVGRALPLLWPLLKTEFYFPLAFLPGASHTGIISYAFWRNLLIEACMLLPVLAAVMMLIRRQPLRAHLPEILLVMSMWSGLGFCLNTGLLL
ncbi:metal-dependent hydrolase [Undibacterium sp.]|uniref:metal-dependent hydrolase n=1 Tax=Undibacterium sp. TaxID=1914977 RepID=UPI002731C7EB|nr:metal-dependent hydrolase [Undibacterium sp.]MDP1979375.1 metal-dependent hydrolase [Undibacterium sp.]